MEGKKSRADTRYPISHGRPRAVARTWCVLEHMAADTCCEVDANFARPLPVTPFLFNHHQPMVCRALRCAAVISCETTDQCRTQFLPLLHYLPPCVGPNSFSCYLAWVVGPRRALDARSGTGISISLILSIKHRYRLPSMLRHTRAVMARNPVENRLALHPTPYDPASRSQ
jgi:hypothetical protein